MEDEKSYRLHISMNFSVKLGQRQKTLTHPKEGATISFEEMIAEVFP